MRNVLQKFEEIEAHISGLLFSFKESTHWAQIFMTLFRSFVKACGLKTDGDSEILFKYKFAFW